MKNLRNEKIRNFSLNRNDSIENVKELMFIVLWWIWIGWMEAILREILRNTRLVIMQEISLLKWYPENAFIRFKYFFLCVNYCRNLYRNTCTMHRSFPLPVAIATVHQCINASLTWNSKTEIKYSFLRLFHTD